MSGRQVMAALNEEWRAVRAEDATSWAAREPSLTGARDLADVLALVRERPDEVLGALLRLGAAGDPRAHRVVFQALLGKVVLVCSRRPGTLPDGLSELWLAIAEYPLERRPRAIAVNLAWAVHRRLPRPLPARPWGDLDPAGVPSDGPDAAATLGEALRLGLIDEQTHRTLWTVYVAGRTSAEAAAVLGTTPELVRWRCSRALRRLSTRADLLCA